MRICHYITEILSMQVARCNSGQQVRYLPHPLQLSFFQIISPAEFTSIIVIILQLYGENGWQYCTKYCKRYSDILKEILQVYTKNIANMYELDVIMRQSVGVQPVNLPSAVTPDPYWTEHLMHIFTRYILNIY